MATPKSHKPEPKPAYVAPDVHVGEIVLWHPEQDAEGDCAAVVTAVAGETISLSCFGTNFFNMKPRDGVRHKDHPDRNIVAATEEGVWSRLPAAQKLHDRLDALEALLAK